PGRRALAEQGAAELYTLAPVVDHRLHPEVEVPVVAAVAVERGQRAGAAQDAVLDLPAHRALRPRGPAVEGLAVEQLHPLARLRRAGAALAPLVGLGVGRGVLEGRD